MRIATKTCRLSPDTYTRIPELVFGEEAAPVTGDNLALDLDSLEWRVYRIKGANRKWGLAGRNESRLGPTMITGVAG